MTKSLDELIKAYECKKSIENRCNKCPYLWVCDDRYHCECEARDNDALHYLKMFRDTINALNVERENCIEAACKYIEAEKELESQKVQMMWVDKHFQFEVSDNPSLTWDELKQMEGKPVWVEEIGGKYATPHWGFIAA